MISLYCWPAVENSPQAVSSLAVQAPTFAEAPAGSRGSIRHPRVHRGSACSSKKRRFPGQARMTNGAFNRSASGLQNRIGSLPRASAAAEVAKVGSDMCARARARARVGQQVGSREVAKARREGRVEAFLRHGEPAFIAESMTYTGGCRTGISCLSPEDRQSWRARAEGA